MAYDKVVDSAKLDADITVVADAIRAKAEITDQLAFPEGMASAIYTISGGASIDVITASSLPTTVVENQIVVITDTTPGTIYVDTNEPSSPVSGDLWVVVAEGDYGINFTEDAPYFSTKFIAAKQYNGSSWVGLDGYIGVSGVWQQFARSLPAMGTPLGQWTWEQIVILANSGEDVTQYFSVGDEKNLTFTTGEVVTYVIGDFYKNTITGTSKNAPLAFTPKNCLNANHEFGYGGWDDASIRLTHMVDIFNVFPAELKADGAIKAVDVVANSSGGAANLVVVSDKLRLHSVAELGLSHQYAPIEGTVYAYYASGNRVKTRNGVASDYWTRSAGTGNPAYACKVTSAGAVETVLNTDILGVAPCFDI